MNLTRIAIAAAVLVCISITCAAAASVLRTQKEFVGEPRGVVTLAVGVAFLAGSSGIRKRKGTGDAASATTDGCVVIDIRHRFEANSPSTRGAAANVCCEVQGEGERRLAA